MPAEVSIRDREGREVTVKCTEKETARDCRDIAIGIYDGIRGKEGKQQNYFDALMVDRKIETADQRPEPNPGIGSGDGGKTSIDKTGTAGGTTTTSP
jgi:hypothetical protein